MRKFLHERFHPETRLLSRSAASAARRRSSRPFAKRQPQAADVKNGAKPTLTPPPPPSKPKTPSPTPKRPPSSAKPSSAQPSNVKHRYPHPPPALTTDCPSPLTALRDGPPSVCHSRRNLLLHLPLPLPALYPPLPLPVHVPGRHPERSEGSRRRPHHPNPSRTFQILSRASIFLQRHVVARSVRTTYTRTTPPHLFPQINVY